MVALALGRGTRLQHMQNRERSAREFSKFSPHKKGRMVSAKIACRAVLHLPANATLQPRNNAGKGAQPCGECASHRHGQRARSAAAARGSEGHRLR